jgi:hypothetical protein
LEQFRYDFELICNNCMTYNLPDTIYYKTAKGTTGSVHNTVPEVYIFVESQSVRAPPK